MNITRWYLLICMMLLSHLVKAQMIKVVNTDTIPHTLQTYNTHYKVGYSEQLIINPGETIKIPTAPNKYDSSLDILIDYENETGGGDKKPDDGGKVKFNVILDSGRWLGREINTSSKVNLIERLSENLQLRAILTSNHKVYGFFNSSDEVGLLIFPGPLRIATHEQVNEKLSEYGKDLASLKTYVDVLENKQEEQITKKFEEDVKNPDSAINAVVRDVVKDELTVEQLTEAVGKSLEQTRKKHADETMLPTGTFYIGKIGYTEKGDFVITPANEQESVCGSVYPKPYYISKKTSNSHQLAAQALSAFVMDGKLKVDTWNNNVVTGVCEIVGQTIMVD